MHPRSISFAAATTACSIRAAPRRPIGWNSFLNGRPIDCAPISLDQYGQTFAACSVDGVDLADWLVRNGLALDWPEYSGGKFDNAQRDAEHAGRGIWQGSYVEPWLFRACIQQGGTAGDCSDDANLHP